MPYLAKGRFMHSLSWKDSPARVAFPAWTLTWLVGLATIGVFIYVGVVALLHQRTLDTARIAAGGSHACELTGGAVRCWGYNGDGEVGDNSTVTRLAPVTVAGLAAGVVALAAGGYHTCALTGGGAVKCWGRNREGQLGDGTQARRLVPAVVAGLEAGVTAIAAGGFHTCALISNGAVSCWGHNRHGQLGTGTATDRAAPTEVLGLGADVQAIAAGADHTCAVTSGGALKCWGYNYYGQLGDNTNSARLTPVLASGLPAPISAVTAGTFHTCALTAKGWIRVGANGHCVGEPRS